MRLTAVFFLCQRCAVCGLLSIVYCLLSVVCGLCSVFCVLFSVFCVLCSVFYCLLSIALGPRPETPPPPP